MDKIKIKKYDNGDMYNVLKKFPHQIEETLDNYKNISNFNNKFSNIIICGMGGSAISGDLLRTLVYNELSIPIFINRDYSIPKWVSLDTLIILSSYSGNTEEVISCYNECLILGNKPIVISSGGYLLQEAEKHHFSFIKMPPGHMPRAALGYSITSLLLLLNNLGVIEFNIKDLRAVVKQLKQDATLYVKNQNNAIELAKKIHNKFCLIYTSLTMEIIGLRFRAQLAENAKILSSHFTFPEHNHNEIEGFENILIHNLAIIWIHDINNHSQISKRMKLTSNMIGKNILQEKIDFKGKNYVNRIMRTIYFLDWVSFYAAIYNNIDPSPVDKISELKLAL